MAAEKFEAAAEFSEGVAKEIRLERARWCREYASGRIEVTPSAPAPSPSDSREAGEERARQGKKKEKAGFEEYIRDNIMRKEKESLPSWNDIGGLENVKDLIKKSVVSG